MVIKFLITIIITSVISSIITAFFIKKYYYSYVEKMFLKLNEVVKKVYGNDKKFWEVDEDYKRKADSLITSAKELGKTYNCIEHKLSDTKIEVSTLERKLETVSELFKELDKEKLEKIKKISEILKGEWKWVFIITSKLPEWENSILST